MNLALTNIKNLIGTHEQNHVLRGKELADLPCIENAYLIIENHEIASFGSMKKFKSEKFKHTDKIIDLTGQFVLPSWCDSHTHLVYAGSREHEFVDKIKGLNYMEIAANGGGILNSAHLLNKTSKDELLNQTWKRLKEVIHLGTGAIEIKSGYGLSVEGELKILRIIKRLKSFSPIPIKTTFLAAHAYPSEFLDDHQGYIDMIIKEMLPVIEHEKLADYIDVFCESGFFSPEETEQICKAGIVHGLKPRLHANQLSLSGGVEVGVGLNAISVDHLEFIGNEEIELLQKSDTIATLLPSAAFFLRMPFQPARHLIDAGCAVSLASDYNPGTSPSGNMNLVVAMSCIQMRMFPEEAINAATLNGACAMDFQEKVGSIKSGKLANLIITKPIPSLAYLPYSFGSNLIDRVIVNGEFFE